MAKNSVIIGEYIITIEDSKSVSVSQIYKSTMQAMREMAALKGMEVPSNWNNQYLGKKLLQTYCGEDAQSGVIGEYTIERQPNGHIDVIRTFKNTIGSLRDIADLIGYKYEDKWNTQTLGRHLVDYIEANKDTIKIAKTAKTQQNESEAEVQEGAADGKMVSYPGDDLICVAKDGQYGFINQKGKVVIPFEYDYALDFSEGLAAVKIDWQFGFIDPTGKMVIKNQYDDAESFCNGLARVTNNWKSGFIDKTGKEVVPIGAYRVNDGFHEGLAKVEKDECGFIDNTGKLVVECKYYEAHNFSEGLAVVCEEEDGCYGYIDPTGNMVLPIDYWQASDFHEGLAAVKSECSFGYIDKTGAQVIPEEWDWANDFHEGLAVVNKDDMHGFIDKTGKVVIPLEYDDASDFHEGLAVVNKDDKYGFIDKTGKIVVPIEYDYAYDFSEGMAMVEKDGDFGFVDSTGKLVIPLNYSNTGEAVYFRKGWAMVYKHGTGSQTSIDKTGKEVK